LREGRYVGILPRSLLSRPLPFLPKTCDLPFVEMLGTESCLAAAIPPHRTIQKEDRRREAEAEETKGIRKESERKEEPKKNIRHGETNKRE